MSQFWNWIQQNLNPQALQQDAQSVGNTVGSGWNWLLGLFGQGGTGTGGTGTGGTGTGGTGTGGTGTGGTGTGGTGTGGTGTGGTGTGGTGTGGTGTTPPPAPTFTPMYNVGTAASYVTFLVNDVNKSNSYPANPSINNNDYANYSGGCADLLIDLLYNVSSNTSFTANPFYATAGNSNINAASYLNTTLPSYDENLLAILCLLRNPAPDPYTVMAAIQCVWRNLNYFYSVNLKTGASTPGLGATLGAQVAQIVQAGITQAVPGINEVLGTDVKTFGGTSMYTINTQALVDILAKVLLGASAAFLSISADGAKTNLTAAVVVSTIAAGFNASLRRIAGNPSARTGGRSRDPNMLDDNTWNRAVILDGYYIARDCFRSALALWGITSINDTWSSITTASAYVVINNNQTSIPDPAGAPGAKTTVSALADRFFPNFGLFSTNAYLMLPMAVASSGYGPTQFNYLYQIWDANSVGRVGQTDGAYYTTIFGGTASPSAITAATNSLCSMFTPPSSMSVPITVLQSLPYTLANGSLTNTFAWLDLYVCASHHDGMNPHRTPWIQSHKGLFTASTYDPSLISYMMHCVAYTAYFNSPSITILQQPAFQAAYDKLITLIPAGM